MVVGHHPFWSGGPHGNRATVKAYMEKEGRPWVQAVKDGVPEAIVDMQTQVLPLLRKHKVQLYLCGHDHHAEVNRDPEGARRDVEEQRYFVPADRFDQAASQATFRNGLLRIVVPPREAPAAAEGIRIDIKTDATG